MLSGSLKLLHILHKMNIFTQKLNPITGINDWEIQDENYDFHQEIARSAFADMLHDTERNKKYYQGLKSAITHMHKEGKQANVLDIGTGTGLLSMMAAECGADTVTACEAFKPIADCALKILSENSFTDQITVIPKRSTDLTVGYDQDLKQRANILVTEVFDTELIGEGALGTFRHAHKYLLESDCIVIPACATVYAQVVESSLLDNWNSLQTFKDSKQNPLINVSRSIATCRGSAAVHDLQLSQLPIDTIKFLTNPVPVLHFDWSGKSALALDQTTSIGTVIKANGKAQAVFVWWDLFMDHSKEVLLSCAPFWAHPDYETDGDPNSIPWRDHWMQAVYYLPRVVDVSKDEEVFLVSCYDEYSTWFNMVKLQPPNSNDYIKPMCDCGLHMAYSRTRLGQINQSDRRKRYTKLLEGLITPDSVCVFIDDGNFLAIVACALGAKKVYAIETNYLSEKLIRSVRDENDFQCRMKILKNVDDLKLTDDYKSINFIMTEPYFMSSILPWDNLHSVYIVQALRKILPNCVDVYPKRAVIRGIAVEFLHLHKIKAPLGTCEGFKMKHFDDLIRNSSEITDANIEPHPLWEYPSVALSHAFTIADFDCTESLPRYVVEHNGVIILTGEGTCNGIALWIDWCIDGTLENVITTGPDCKNIRIGEKITNWDMYTKQGVYFVPNFEANKKFKSLHYSEKYNPKNESISFSFVFS